MKKKWIYWVGLFLCLEGVLRLFPTNQGTRREPVNKRNPVMTFQKNREFVWSKGWNFSIAAKKHSNNYGFLNLQDYDNTLKSPLMAIIGDSFVEAAQVSDNMTMYGLLAKEVSSKGRVYSFGVANSQLATYLAYADYVKNEFHPDSMVFIIVGNDFDESLLKYKSVPGYYYFYEGNQQSLSLKRIDWKPPLWKMFIRNFAIARYFFLNLNFIEKINIDYIKLQFMPYDEKIKKFSGNTSSKASAERITDSRRVVDQFFKSLPSKSGLSPDNILFVLDGVRPHLYSDAGLKEAQKSYVWKMRGYFSHVAKNRGYAVLDMQPLFLQENQDHESRFEFKNDCHWNEMGHRLVANAISSSALFSNTFDGKKTR